MEEDYEGFCWIHNEFEPFDPKVDYWACGECMHVYRTAADLVEANNKMADFIHLESIKTDKAADISVCPLCTHDF